MPKSPKPVNIKDLRRRLGIPGRPLSQAELAERLGGINQSTVSRMEADPATQKGAVAVLLRSLDLATPEPKITAPLFFGPAPD